MINSLSTSFVLGLIRCLKECPRLHAVKNVCAASRAFCYAWANGFRAYGTFELENSGIHIAFSAMSALVAWHLTTPPVSKCDLAIGMALSRFHFRVVVGSVRGFNYLSSIHVVPVCSAAFWAYLHTGDYRASAAFAA